MDACASISQSFGWLLPAWDKSPPVRLDGYKNFHAEYRRAGGMTGTSDAATSGENGPAKAQIAFTAGFYYNDIVEDSIERC